MKRMLMICIFVSIFFYSNVTANIVCNDGTVSKTCTDCHRGCCSGHDGCTDNPNHEYKLTDSSTTTRTTTTTNKKADNAAMSNDDTKYYIFGTGVAIGSVATYIINKKKQ